MDEQRRQLIDKGQRVPTVFLCQFDCTSSIHHDLFQRPDISHIMRAFVSKDFLSLHGIESVPAYVLLRRGTKWPTQDVKTTSATSTPLSYYSQIAVVRTKIMRYTYLYRLIPIFCFAMKACGVKCKYHFTFHKSQRK